MAYPDPARPGDGTPASRPYPLVPDLLSIALLLAVLAPVGIEFGRLSFWDRFTQPWPALLCGALCCGLAALNRRPGWWLAVVVALGGLFTAVALYRLMPGPSLALRDQQLRAYLLQWIDQLRGGQEVYADLAVDAWSTAAAWLVGMWAAWAALRAGWHWLVLAAGGALLASTIGNLPHWPATALAVYVFAALLFLAWLHQRRLVAGALVRGDSREPGGGRAWSLHLVAVAAGALVLVGIGWLSPAVHWQAPQLAHRPRPSAGNGLHFFPAAEGRTTLHDFGPTLQFSGAISLGDNVVASVDAPGSGYLFGVAYDRYASDGWDSTAVDQPRHQASERPAASTDEAAAGRGRLGLRLGDDVYQDTASVNVTVRPAEPSSVLLAAGPPVGVARPAGSLPAVSARALRGAPFGELSELVAAQPIQPGGSYSTGGLVSSATADALRADAGPASDWLRSSYLQLPRSLPDRVRNLASELIKDASNDYDRALAIESYLRRLPYDQNIAAPPPGEDGVDYLLFVAGRGYCDYFASAMAVMLRSVGVPARVVAGYVMHESGPNGLYELREHDAHAWTEVFFPDYGWQRFDPTPGGAATFAAAAGQSIAPGVSALALAAATPPGVQVPAQAAAAPPAPAPQSPLGQSPLGPAPAGHGLPLWLLWSSLVGLCATAAAYWWLLSQRNPRRAAMSAWHLTAVAARVLNRGQQPHETPAEYAASIVRASPAATEMQNLAAVYGRARYGPPGTAMPRSHLPWRQAISAAIGLVRGRLKR